MKKLDNAFSSRGFVTDGAARAEIKLAYSLPSRDGGRQLVNPCGIYLRICNPP